MFTGRAFPSDGPIAAGGGLKAFVRGLAPAAWFMFNTGITSATSLVSQWNDQSGNGRHLKQATGTNQPTVQADGSILFDGVDNYLKCDAFTFNQPETIYILGKQVTWTINDRWMDGDTVNSGVIYQNAVTPDLSLFAGDGPAATNAGLAVDTYGVIAAVFNGASSLLQINNGAPTTGNPLTAGLGGFTLGATATPNNYGNIQVKEVILYAAAHDADTRRRVIRYLGQVGGLSI